MDGLVRWPVRVVRIAGLVAGLAALGWGLGIADEAQGVRVAAASYAQVVLHYADPLVVEPVAISDAYALADWVAGLKEGEVLLVRNSSTGKWHVVALENSSLADARFLTARFDVPPATARSLVRALRAAEQRESGH